jgi:AICAR transformylase/IMP cyclohydrolase PurH
MKFAHIACDTSHGPRPVPPAAPSVVRCASRCSASLSNSVVNAISSRDSNVGKGRSSAVTAPRYAARRAAS